MKQLMLGWLLFGFLSGQALAAQTTQIEQRDPVKLVDALSHVVISELNKQREALKQDPKKIRAFANQYVLPYVDTKKMARYVMGVYWRRATPAQQQAFINEFTETLLRAYANSMLNLKIDVVEITGSQPEGKRGDRVIVSTKVKQADGNVSRVQYRAYRDKKTHFWSLYDVVIEGVSMLLNYRKTYAVAFQQKGIDGVITEMRAKNKDFE